MARPDAGREDNPLMAGIVVLALTAVSVLLEPLMAILLAPALIAGAGLLLSGLRSS